MAMPAKQRFPATSGLQAPPITVRAPNLGSNLESDSPIRSGIDDDLQRLGIRSLGKGVVGNENFRKPEVMSDQSLRVDFPRLNGPSSMGVVTVSTRRVLKVMLWDQRRSRCRSTLVP